MSSYYEYKVLRLPLDNVDMKDKDTDDLEDLMNSLGIGFTLTMCSSENMFIDLELEHKISEGEWGFSRKLTDIEHHYAEILFNKLDIDYDVDDIHFVNYCYYNCSEPREYYAINSIDVASSLRKLCEKF